ncbi:outer membrane beta-barrel protein [Pontibacter korlensis]|uniref:Outer membrane protein beta-barrel domain-containing protein n=1 Tax=Pontibacter korlensis TaxID=400092 RepID=A0A0E3ZJE2_9BACT|nr:outer membrane beta-barrel protein [Pontibacter korlensis]AKD05180.1 hypothetical protein PKOR_21565 [Pontibacter korlensis]
MSISLLGTASLAQTSQGTVVVSGGLSLNTFKSETTESDTLSHQASGTAFRIGPSVGFMLGNNFELGAALGYSHSTTTNKNFNREGDSNETKERSKAFSISPYLKKYFMLSEQFALTGQFSAALSIHKRQFNADSKLPSTFFHAALAPGITYFPSEKLGVSASLGGLRYEQTSKKMEAGGTPIKTLSGFIVSFEDALYFSLSYYINR